MQNKNKRIVLIGYMYCGKTTLGKQLAKRMRYEFYDIDKEIENICHYNITTIFHNFGEDFFRKTEKKILQSLLEKEHVVISCGGGTPCFYDNMENIKQQSFSIHLSMTCEQILARHKKTKTPRYHLNGKTYDEALEYIKKTLNQRLFYYNQADLTIDAFNIKVTEIENLIKNNQ